VERVHLSLVSARADRVLAMDRSQSGREWTMTPFEHLFSFYGLLLGLAAANVATGFAETWRDRRHVAIGVCGPLIALIVLLGAMNLWLSFWAIRESVDLNGWRMIGVAGIALPYVFISRAMFPGAGGAASLEEQYFGHRRVMLVALATSPVVSMLTNLLLNHGLQANWNTLWLAMRAAIPLALLPFSNRTANRLGLGAMVIFLLVGLFR
jgi:hypothetical protein